MRVCLRSALHALTTCVCSQRVVDLALPRGVLLTRGKYVAEERFRPAPSLRLCVPASLTPDEARKALETVVSVAETVAAE